MTSPAPRHSPGHDERAPAHQNRNFPPRQPQGDVGAGADLSDDTVAAIAANYDPAKFEAPVVAGHPTHDAPAYGWAKKLEFSDGKLLAVADQFDPAFADAVKAGRYKKVSACFYPPDHHNNPTPGQYYLRHIGFLGAAAPAVPGLKSVEFSDDAAGLVTFSDAVREATLDLSYAVRGIMGALRGLRDWIVEREGLAKANEIINANNLDWNLEHVIEAQDKARDKSPRFSDPEPQPKKETDLTDKEKALAEREAEIAAREKQIAQKEVEARAQENAAFAEGLVKDGRLLPSEKDGAVAFLNGLGPDQIAFADGDAKPQADMAWFKGFLSGLPPRVAFGEIAPASAQPAEFDNPGDIAKAAVEFAEGQRAKGVVVTVTDAVAHVMKEGKKK